MTELIWMARGIIAVSAFQFALGLFGIERLFGTWDIDRKTVIVTAIVTAFGGAVLMVAGGGA